MPTVIDPTTIHVTVNDGTGTKVIDPTFTDGEWKIEIDGVANNLETLPVAVGGGSTDVTVTLSDAEFVEGAVVTYVDDEGLWLGPAIRVENSDSVIGPGAVVHQVTICDVDDRPIPGVEVWVSADIAGEVVVAGTLVTDQSGNAIFMLDPGTFYLWQNSTKFNFQNPTQFKVAG
jgi:hypothetical protein